MKQRCMFGQLSMCFQSGDSQELGCQILPWRASCETPQRDDGHGSESHSAETDRYRRLAAIISSILSVHSSCLCKPLKVVINFSINHTATTRLQYTLQRYTFCLSNMLLYCLSVSLDEKMSVW